MPTPADVPEVKERRCAWALYVLLISVFLGYMVWTVVDAVQAREDPPTSFEKESNVWRLPHVVAEGVAPIIGECTFSLATDDEDVERECRSEFYPDEESENDEGVIVFFLGDFDIETMRDEYEESAGADDPEFDHSFVEGFVVLGFEEVGELWEVPVGLCSHLEFDELEEVNYGSILDACPINTYVPVGPVEEGADSRAYASNFVLEAEVFRTLDGFEEYTYSSSVSSTVWAIPAGEYDEEFSSSLIDSSPMSAAAAEQKSTSDPDKDSTATRHSKPRRGKTNFRAHSRGIELQQASSYLGYVGQVWVYQQGWQISATEEVDPLEPLALIGQWGGAFTYVAIIFGVVFVAGKGGVRYNRFSKASREKYKRTPASKKGEKKKDKKKKKKGKKEKDEKEEDEEEDEDEEDEDSGDDGGDDDGDFMGV